jgi:hypothetical protein
MPWRDLSHRKACRRYDQPGDADNLRNETCRPATLCPDR